MKYERTDSFLADFKMLKKEHRDTFLKTLREELIPACESCAEDPSSSWPKSLRVKSVQGAEGIWEMTWSLSGPDGRATFELIKIGGEIAIRWRRVGDHAVFKRP
jgi:hypothetical protein